MEDMFFECDSLKSLPDMSNLNTPMSLNVDLGFEEFDSFINI